MTGALAARVLLVEDTPTQAQLARALLVGLGHQVEVVESAGAALTVGAPVGRRVAGAGGDGLGEVGGHVGRVDDGLAVVQ